MRVLRDTGLVFVRSMRPTLRNPAVLISGVGQPAVFLVLFGPLLSGFAGTTASWQWYVPGLLIQMGLFGTAYAGFAIMPEIRSGALERMRVTPVSRAALLLGRVLRDVLLLVVQSALLVALAALLFDFHARFADVLLVLAFAGLLGVSIAATSYALALKLKHEYAFAPVLSAVTMPLLLLSGVLLPMSAAPDWLYTISRINPVSHVVDGVRAVAVGDLTSSSVLIGGLVTLALIGVCLYWGVRTFRRENS